MSFTMKNDRYEIEIAENSFVYYRVLSGKGKDDYSHCVSWEDIKLKNISKFCLKAANIFLKHGAWLR